MKQNLPIEWYVARLNYLDSLIKESQKVRKGVHRGVEIIRYFDGDKWHQVSAKNEKAYKKYFEKYIEYDALLREFTEILNDWKRNFSVSYYAVRDNYVVRPNVDSRLTKGLWDKLTDNQCSVENKSNYYYDNHNFRSRAEQRIAEVANELHLSYKYEAGIVLTNEGVYPDFTFVFPEFNRCTFMEYYGKLADKRYQLRANEKNLAYIERGIYDNRDLFMICGDADYMPNGDAIKTILISMVTLLCHLYVSKRTNTDQ